MQGVESQDSTGSRLVSQAWFSSTGSRRFRENGDLKIKSFLSSTSTREKSQQPSGVFVVWKDSMGSDGKGRV